MSIHIKASLLLTVFLLMSGPLNGNDGGVQVAGWRNDGSGIYPDADIPTEWSEDKNIIWKTPLDSWSNASPILVGDRVFVCSEPTTLVCVDTKDGSILWQKENHYFDSLPVEEAATAKTNLAHAEVLKQQVNALQDELDQLNEKRAASPDNAEITQQIAANEDKVKALKAKIEALGPYSPPKTHDTNGYSSPTPTSDGEYVYVLFGTGTVGCYDLEGKRQWLKFIQAPTNARGWGHSASPVLVGDKLVIHIRNIFALDKRSGNVIWQAESKPAWGSPVYAQIADVDVVITASGDVFRADDGVLLAREVSSLEYATAVVDGNKVYFVENGGKAIKLPDEAAAGMTPEVLWETTPKKDRYYASVILRDGLIYAVTRNSHYSVIDAATGAVVFEQTLELGKGTTYPSITWAGNRLLVSSDNGTTLVLRPGLAYDLIASNKIEGFRSSPLIADKRMYIRGLNHLYCIGK